MNPPLARIKRLKDPSGFYHTGTVRTYLYMKILNMKREWPGISVTVDIALFKRDSKSGVQVLLVRRKNAPFKGKWALPGGFVETEEDLEAAARRELEEETGMRPVSLEQMHTFGRPGRDPRGRTVSIVFSGFAQPSQQPTAGDDAAEAAWFNVQDLPELAFDHQEILKMAVSRLS